MSLENPTEEEFDDDIDASAAVLSGIEEIEKQLGSDPGEIDSTDIDEEFDHDLAALHAIEGDDEDEDEPLAADTLPESESESDPTVDDEDDEEEGNSPAHIPSTLEQLKLLGEEEPVIEVQTTSKAARARAYFIANFGKTGFERKHFIAKFKSDYELSPAGAGTYYQKFIDEAREGKITPKHGIPAPKK